MDSCLKPNLEREQTLVPKTELTEFLRLKDCDHAQKQIDHHPDNYSDGDLYQVAKCFYTQSDVEKSERIFQHLIATPATTPLVRAKALYALAKIAANTGDAELALKKYEEKFQRDPSDVDSLCQMARLSLIGSPSRPEWDAMVRYTFDSIPPDPWTYICIADYARATTTMPDAARIADQSCRAMLSYEGFEKKAFDCLKRNADHLNYDVKPIIDVDQERFWIARIQHNPADVAALHELADTYYGRGHYVWAADVLESAVNLETESEQKADTLDRLARAYYLAGSDDLAQSTWEKLNQTPGLETRFEFSQAMRAMAEMRYEDAMTILSKADMVPGQFHRLASSARIASFLSTYDYSRVGKDSSMVFAQALEWCNTHLNLYPDDETVLHGREYVNWRVKEAQGKPLDIVTPFTAKVIANGRRWDNALAGVYLTYAGLAYIHQGKGIMNDVSRESQSAENFAAGEALFGEVFAKTAQLIASDDPLEANNLIETWLSLGWSKFYRKEFDAAAKIFEALALNHQFQDDQVLVKQKIEALRGLGTSMDRLARTYFKTKDFETADRVSSRAVQMIESALKIEADEWANGYVQPKFSFNFSREVIDGSIGVIEQEELRFVRAGYRVYLRTLFPAVRNETQFNLAVARYWNAKIVRGWSESQPAKRKEATQHYAQAAKEFEAVLAAVPNHAESHRFLEAIAVANGDIIAAVKKYHDAIHFGTDEPADAARQLILGVTEHIARLNSGDSSETHDAKQINGFKIARLEAAIAYADYLGTPESLDAAMKFAEEIAKNAEICDPAGPYGDGLKEMVQQVNALLERSSPHERNAWARIHQKVMTKLGPCLSLHHISMSNGVSLTPSRVLK